MRIRRFQIGDEPALSRVFHSAIHEIARHDYTREQIDAWAPADFDEEMWADKMRRIRPFVAEDGSDVVGYADVQTSGYIDHFFVSGFRPRQGIGAMLMARIHEEAATLALAELTSNVSRTAEPFFQHYGFTVVERRAAITRGVTIPNTLMRKRLVRPS